MKEILNLLQLQHLHIKIRHTALNASQEELYNDLLYIIKQWNKMIMQMNIAANKQRIIHQSFNFLANILLSSNLWEIKNIITNNVETHNAIKKILTKHLPNETHKLSLFQKNIPIFNYYNLNQTINNIFSHKIPFLQNAYLIIDQTEACTVIDINSGNTRNTNNIEHNLYINQNAIPTIIQQIIIKNISGLIIIDFIEMNSETSIKTIENELTTQIKTNKIEAKISTMNEFGIITISRKRIYMNTNELFFNTCNQCNGQGAITNNNYNVYQALIHIENKLYNSDQQFTYIQIPSNIIHILLTHHRKRIDIIEKQYNKKIIFCN
ncbi:MAG: ribonuclease E/G [Pseudomonadota bacterium]